MFTKKQWERGTLRKTWIIRFWTASITYTRQFGARAEKSWFLNQKYSGLLNIIKSEHVFYSIASLSCSKPCPKPWFFRKSSMGTLEKSQIGPEFSRLPSLWLRKHWFHRNCSSGTPQGGQPLQYAKNQRFWTRNQAFRAKITRIGRFWMPLSTWRLRKSGRFSVDFRDFADFARYGP